MNVTFYGIPNCDTVKKARLWLGGRGVAYAFHDYKKAGADAAILTAWCATAGWEKVLNRSGTTFRMLTDADKDDLDAARAVRLMVAHPSAIKRPIVVHGRGLLIGFDQARWEQAFG